MKLSFEILERATETTAFKCVDLFLTSALIVILLAEMFTD